MILHETKPLIHQKNIKTLLFIAWKPILLRLAQNLRIVDVDLQQCFCIPGDTERQ